MTEQLTIFTAPRPFTGEFERIQLNALYSWTQLDPRPDIVVFGNEVGTAQACDRLGLRWVRDVATADSGAPLLNALFDSMRAIARDSTVMYVNADIIASQSLISAISAARRALGPSILVAAPWNVDVPFRLEETNDWRSDLDSRVEIADRRPTAAGADLFLFDAGAFDPVPPLVIGRLGWDNWLFWKACSGDLPVCDISAAANLIHQDHAATTHRGSDAATRSLHGQEIAENTKAIRWWARITARSDVPLTLERDLVIHRRRRGGRVRILMRVGLRQARIIIGPRLRRSSVGRALLDRVRVLRGPEL